LADADKGQCGDEVAEEQESSAIVIQKAIKIADAVREAGYVVAHTGAGISTAAGEVMVVAGRGGLGGKFNCTDSLIIKTVCAWLCGVGIPDFRGKHGIWTREKRGELAALM